MSIAVETSPPAPSTTAAPSRIGPFAILGRIPGEGGGGIVSLSVKGLDGTPFAGRHGVAQCFAAPKDEAGRTHLGRILANLVGMDHPAIAAPLHADVAGNVAYVVNRAPVDESPGVLAHVEALPPSLVAEYLIPVSAGLETAHRAGFSHGDLSRRSVALQEGSPVIGGWTLFGRGPEADQAGLANLVIDWLAGAALPETISDGASLSTERRVERLRRHVDGLTEQLVLVLARASEAEPDNRYPSVTDFVVAFQEAVTRSGEDLVHGGFEAISNRSPEVAALMAASAERYDQQAQGLDLLKLHLGNRSVPYASVVAPSGTGGMGSPPVTSGPSDAAAVTGLDPMLTAGIPPEMLALIAPAIAPVAKPRNNPWLVMIVGAAGLTLLLMVGLAIAVFANSN